jgi:hypothetical protein
LKTLSPTKGTFFENQGDIFVPLVEDEAESVKQTAVDFTDWFAEAAGVKAAPVLNEETLQELFDAWVFKVRELVPDKTPPELWKGAWQVYLDLEFMTDAQLKAYRNMETVRGDVLTGGRELTAFRCAFVEWVSAGASFYQNGVCVPQSAAKLKVFRERLQPHLTVEGFDDG